MQIVSLLLEVAGKVESERVKAEGMTDIQKLKETNFVVGMPSMVSSCESATHSHAPRPSAMKGWPCRGLTPRALPPPSPTLALTLARCPKPACAQPAKVKSVSISTMKAQQQELVDSYQRICREMSRLKPLMRLVDYMVRVWRKAVAKTRASNRWSPAW